MGIYFLDLNSSRVKFSAFLASMIFWYSLTSMNSLRAGLKCNRYLLKVGLVLIAEGWIKAIQAENKEHVVWADLVIVGVGCEIDLSDLGRDWGILRQEQLGLRNGVHKHERVHEDRVEAANGGVIAVLCFVEERDGLSKDVAVFQKLRHNWNTCFFLKLFQYFF